ncbi:MAG: PAS domain S-box protein [Acidobacteria bacterium]|nr:PAS domain S-box protein [Acidobacteriota bacterium]
MRAYVELAPTAIAAAVVAAAALAFLQRPVIASPSIALWLLSLTPPLAYRAWLAHTYRRAPGRWAAAAWLSRCRVAYCSHGVAWGLANVLMFPAENIPHQAIVAFTLAGLTASSVTLTAFDLPAGMVFLFVTLVPLVARLFLDGGTIGTTMAVMVAAFLLFMVANSRRAARGVVENMSLRRAAAARAEALAGFQTTLSKLRHSSGDEGVDVFQAVIDDTSRLVGRGGARLWLLDETGGALQLRATSGAATDVRGSGASLPARQIPDYLALMAESDGFSAANVREHPVLADLAETALLSPLAVSRLDAPIRAGGRLVGVLCCEDVVRHDWTADEQTFVMSAAAVVAAAIEETRRREAESALRRVNENLESLVAERSRALVASEQRLSLALEATTDGLFDWQARRKGVYYNPAFARLLGYGPEEIDATASFFWRHVHPDDAGHVNQALQACLEGLGPGLDVECRLRTKSGDYKWFLGRAKAVERTPDKETTRVVGTITDITERKHAVIGLRKSEEMFRAVFDGSTSIIALMGVDDRRLTELNAAGCTAFGITREEAVGHTMTELRMWGDWRERDELLAVFERDGSVFDRELQMRRRNGELFWTRGISSVITVGGQPFRLATLEDITERRQLEARVTQSQKMEVVGHLAGGIAHDFNNVLTVITGAAEMAIAAAPDGGRSGEDLKTILDASMRAARLTHQLLAFSRRQILQPAVVCLGELVTTLGPMLRRVIGQHITIHTHASEPAATVVADRGSLEQVVLNLAINSRDAMPEGGTLTIGIDHARVGAAGGNGAPHVTPGRYVTLTVADTGVGMDEETRRRMFEPFFTTKDVGKGTGLGLSTVHGIVTQSGGGLQVTSAVGAGTSV